MSSFTLNEDGMIIVTPPATHRDDKNDQPRIQYIKDARERVRNYAQTGMKSNGDVTTDVAKAQIQTTSILLSWLAEHVNMNPFIEKETSLQITLHRIQDTKFRFPSELQEQAKQLLAKWQGTNWGAPPGPVPGGSTYVTAESDASTVEQDDDGTVWSVVANSGDGKTHLPPQAHAIWGRRGIMHGLARRQNSSGRLSNVINPDYYDSKRSAKVYGHNNIPVGQWFPFQLSALFHGAHGAPQAGIHGVTDQPAYSIVVSDTYEGMDDDHGKTLFYSGSNSHENEDACIAPPSSTGTRCLIASLNSGVHVRVLRAAFKISPHAPSVGLRYDGLYKVVDHDTAAVNANGGLYERFKLERDDAANGLTLQQCKQRPSNVEESDYRKIGEKYWS